MDLGSGRNRVFLELLKVMAEMGDHVVLDRAASLSCGFEFGEAADCRGSFVSGRCRPQRSARWPPSATGSQALLLVPCP